MNLEPNLLPLAAEAVAYPAHGLEVDRLAGVRLEVAPQADDEVIQGPGFGIGRVAPHRLEQLAARDGLPLLLEEEREDAHLHLGQVDLSLGGAGAVGEQEDLV